MQACRKIEGEALHLLPVAVLPLALSYNMSRSSTQGINLFPLRQLPRLRADVSVSDRVMDHELRKSMDV
jgi:hypothetical protein